MMAAGVAGSMLIGAAVFAAEKTKAAPAPENKESAPADKWAFLPEVVAEIDGKKISKAEIVKSIDAQLSQSPYAAMFTPEMLERIAPNIVKGYVDKEVLLKMAAKDGIKPDAAMVIKDFKEKVAKLPAEQVDAFKKRLEAQGKTLDSYIDEMSKDKNTQDQVAIGAWVEKTIEPKVKVTEKDEKDFYDKNKDEFKVPESVKASHILIKSEGKEEKAMGEAKGKAVKLLADIKANKAKFEDVAEKESACPSGKRDKGSLGEFKRGQMVPAFEQVAFSLKPGEISEVVETPFGFHIIRVESSTPEKQLEFKDVQKDIEQNLKGEQMQKQVMDVLADGRKQFKVKVFLKEPEAPKAPAEEAK